MDPNKIQNLIKIDEIHNVLKREIQLTNGPQPIPQNLYQNIANLVYLLNEQNERDELEFSIQEEEDDNDNDNDTTTTTTAEAATTAISKQINSELITMIAKLTSLLFILRCKKIFNSPKSSPESFEYSNLTDEEKYVFFGNREREKRIDVILKMLLDGKPKTLEKIVSSINENFVIVRFLDSMDQFVGVNMNKYGPFKKDDVAILPFENARPILESNKAVEIRKLV